MNQTADGRPQTADGSTPGGWVRRLPSAVCCLIALLPFAKALLFNEVFVLRDHLDYFQPLRWFTAMQLRGGVIPLWNPYSASGEPWLANPQTGVFYPPTWLFLILPFALVYTLFLYAHVALLGCGAFRLFSKIASREAALAGAVALMFSGPVLSLLDVQNNLATLAWVPLVLCCALEARPLLGGITLALAFLAGEPFFAAIAALGYVVLDRRIRNIVPAALVAFGLSAVQLLPFLETLRGSDRGAGMDREVLLRNSVPLRDWLGLAIRPEWNPFHGQQFIPIVYAGTIVCLLALIGISTRRRAVWWALGVLMLCIVVAAGSGLWTHVAVRYPARVVPFAAFAIAVLATLGVDRLRPGRGVAAAIVVLISADLLFAAVPLLHSEPFRTDRVPYGREVGADAKIVRIGPLPPDRAKWISGYLNLYGHRFDADTAAPVTTASYLRLYNDALEHRRLDVLAFLGAGWFLVSRGNDVEVHRNPAAFPLAAFWVPGEAKPHPAHVEELAASRVTVRVSTARDGILVLAQQDAPGWRVSIDGVPAPKLLVRGIFRGVDVKKGAHTVVWMYCPHSFFAGGVMTLITLFAIEISQIVKRRRAKNFSSVAINPGV